MKNVLLMGDSSRIQLLKVSLESRQKSVMEYDEAQKTEQAKWAELVVYVMPLPETDTESSIWDVQDWAALEQTYDSLACGFLRSVHGMWSEMRPNVRIGIWTDAKSSVNWCTGTGDFARRMSIAAVNRAAMLLFHARKPGMTMRVCAALDPTFAAECFLRNRSYEEDNLPHSDENRLSMRGEHGMELPW